VTLDDLRTSVGKELGVSDWREVTQQQIDQFAKITGDDQWIHIDRDRAARESPYGTTTIAHGFLTVGLLSSLINEAIEITGDFKMRVNYGLNRLRFTGAVPSGSRIRGRFTLHSIKDVDGGVELAWLSTVEVEGRDKPALVAEWLGRTYY
jgi:acyl dehydratase